MKNNMNYYNQYNFNQNNDQPESAVSPSPAEAIFIEKCRIKRAGNAIGAALVIFLILPWIASLGLPLLADSLGISAQSLSAFLEAAPGNWIYQNLLSVLVMTIPFMIGSWVYGMKLKNAVALSSPRKGTTLPLVLMGFGACGVSNLVGSFVESVFSHESNSAEDIMGQFPQGFFGVVLVFLSVCVLPALLEEFAFRGVVLGVVSNISKSFAIFISALVFALMHSNFSQIPFAFVLGLFLGYAAVVSGSILPACIVHLLSNSVAVVITYLSATMPKESVMVLNIIFYLAMLIVGIVGFILFVKRRGDTELFAKEQPTLSAAAKFWLFISRPCMVLFVIGVVIQAVILELRLL